MFERSSVKVQDTSLLLVISVRSKRAKIDLTASTGSASFMSSPTIQYRTTGWVADISIYGTVDMRSRYASFGSAMSNKQEHDFDSVTLLNTHTHTHAHAFAPSYINSNKTTQFQPLKNQELLSRNKDGKACSIPPMIPLSLPYKAGKETTATLIKPQGNL